MRLEAHRDAAEFLDAAGSLLASDEARHNLIYGICSTLIDAPSAYPEAYFWTIGDGVVVGAALMTPPFNIVVARPLDPDALPFAARALHAQGVDLPGVTAAVPEVEAFAQSWEALAGVRCRLGMSQGVYAARSVRLPEEVPGNRREAGPDDREVVLEWIRAFQDEALAQGAPAANLEQVVDRRLESETAGIALWELDAKPVSLCGYGGRTPHGIRIGPVYTPPELRRRGYASALTAHVTKRLLDGGREYCFLYTDLANPTSNRIYMNVGYERVCDSAEYAFEKAGV